MVAAPDAQQNQMTRLAAHGLLNNKQSEQVRIQSQAANFSQAEMIEQWSQENSSKLESQQMMQQN